VKSGEVPKTLSLWSIHTTGYLMGVKLINEGLHPFQLQIF